MATVSYAHIEPNAEGEPIIAGTRIKVRMIALDRIAHGWDAEEIQRHHPDLSLGQIHSALAYYSDHKQEMDRDVADRHERVTKLRAGAGESPGRRASGAGPAPVSIKALHGSSCGYRDHRRAPSAGGRRVDLPGRWNHDLGRHLPTIGRSWHGGSRRRIHPRTRNRRFPKLSKPPP